ncbi:MAG: 30S ribosomal protein S8 [Deltaproteobacteria bacterium]|nr:30S ribosomal protein S8 [Deltaproteobacteria bacterium]
MSMTDPIADLLTRIRNGLHSGQKDVTIPASKLKAEIVRILKEQGYIKDFKVLGEGISKSIKVQLKYVDGKNKVITKIKRVSKPGLRVYVGKDNIPAVLNGLGISIISTSKGILADKSARELGLGGELLCTVY